MRLPRSGSVAAGGFAVGFAAGWNIANTGAAAPSLREAYGTSLAAVGLLTTALFCTHFAAQIPGGALVDRVGARRVGLVSLAVMVTGNAAALAAASLPLALAARVLIGLGTGAGFVAGSDWIRAAGGSTSAQGLYGGLSVGGGGVAIGVVPLLEGVFGWRSPYATALVVASLLAVVLLAAPSPARRAAAASGSVRRLLGDRALYPLAAVHTASFGLSVIAGNWVVSLLKHDGVSREVAGGVGALVLLGGLLTRPLAGVVVRRRPELTALLVAASLLAGGVGTAVLALRAPLAVLVAAAAAVGLAAGVPFAAVFAGAQRLRPGAPAAAIGVVNSAATLTILVGTPLVGLTFALPGEGRIGFAVLAAVWTSALAAVPAARRSLTVRGLVG